MSSLEEEKDQLVSAYNISVSTNATNEQRLNAYHIIESFKQSPTRCLSVGSRLICRQESETDRLLGFDLINAFVREGWASSPPVLDEVKAKCKHDIIIYLRDGLKSQFQDESERVKLSLTRVIVSLILQDFPQCWPDVFSQLLDAASCGSTQMHVVFNVFLAVAEDIVVIQNLSIPPHRTKDIRQGLNMSGALTSLLSMLMHCLSVAITNNTQLQGGGVNSDPGAFENSLERHMALAALKCLAGYISWLPHKLVFQSTQLLETLCLLLTIQSLRVAAAECLVQLLTRKGSNVVERAPILAFFRRSVLQYLMDSAASVFASRQEQEYNYVKKLVEIITAMSQQYIFLCKYNEVKDISEQDMQYFVETALHFSKHPSPYVAGEVMNLSLTLLKNSDKDPKYKVFSSHVDAVYDMCERLITKVGHPSKNDHPSCAFVKLECDDDREFANFIGQSRSTGCDLIRRCLDLFPEETFRVVSGRYTSTLAAYRATPKTGARENGVSVVTMEAACMVMNSLTNKVVSEKIAPLDSDQSASLVNQCVPILHQSVSAAESEEDAIVLSSLLTVISGLFGLWTQSADLFVRILQLLFKTLRFQDANRPYKVVNGVHRHASSLLLSKINLSPQPFIPLYNEMQPAMLQYIADSDNDNNCRASLVESLVALTTRLDDSSSRDAILSKILQQGMQFVHSTLFKSISRDVIKFVNFLGITQGSAENDDSRWKNMQELRFVSMTFNGYIRRLTTKPVGCDVILACPDDECPGYSLVMAFMDDMLALLRMLHDLHNQSVKDKLSGKFALVLDLPEIERVNLLGIRQNTSDDNQVVVRSDLEKKQLYLKELHCNISQALCGCILKCPYYLSANPQYLTVILDTIFYNFSALSEVYLSNLLLFFLQPLRERCPSSGHKGALFPTMRRFFISVLPVLTKHWENVNQLSFGESGGDSAKDTEDDLEEECSEDLFLRRNTKCVIMTIESLMLISSAGKNSDRQLDASVVENMSGSTGKQTLSEFASLVVNDTKMYESVLLILINSLVWPDTHNCCKTAIVLWPIMAHSLMNNPASEAVGTIFTQVLKALQVNGSDNTCHNLLLSLILQIYLTLRPSHQIIKDILRQVPGVDYQFLDSYEQSVFGAPSPEDCIDQRAKRDGMKKLLKGIVGQPLSAMYRDHVKYLKLPTIQPAVKPEADTGFSLDALAGLYN
jgi:exportin-5